MREIFFSFIVSLLSWTIISCGQTTEEGVASVVSSANDAVNDTTGAIDDSLFGDTEDGDQGKVRYNNAASYMKFDTGGPVERVRINQHGLHSSFNLGIAATDTGTEHIAGAASSFIGLYMNDGFIGFPTALNRDGGYFIATHVNALNAGPVSLGSSMTLHGTWTIV